MTAYSFERQFVDPIRVGLGLAPMVRESEIPGVIPCTVVGPKLQTIRADHKRHARPGEEVQLYCGMRTKHCFLIGRATCIGVTPIIICVEAQRIIVDIEKRYPQILETVGDLHTFANADGFPNWSAMREFWRTNYPFDNFVGVIIRWEPRP
jgi:hypothetical protein